MPKPLFDPYIPLHARVIDLRSQGLSVPKIVKRLAKEGTPLVAVTVYQLINEYAQSVRESILELGTNRFAEADARLEYLYRQVVRRLRKAAVAPECDDAKYAALIRAALAVLERQARLLGLDKTKERGGTGNSDWLEGKTPAQLVQLAGQWGIQLPERFVNQN